MGKFRAVFFDLDGTLWDKIACSDYVLELILPKLSSYLPDRDAGEIALRFNAALIDLLRTDGLTGELSRSGPARFDRLLASCGVRREGLGRKLSMAYNAARRLAMPSFLRPGATHVLGRLHDLGLKCGVITNGSFAVQRHVIEALGLEGYLDHCVIGEIEGYSKPDPRLFRRALELAEVKPKRMLYVGDSIITDVIGASRAGIPVAWLRTDDQPLPHGFPVPDYDIEDLREVLPIVAA